MDLKLPVEWNTLLICVVQPLGDPTQEHDIADYFVSFRRGEQKKKNSKKESIIEDKLPCQVLRLNWIQVGNFVNK